MSKIYLGLITSAGNAEHLNWYNGISDHIDGLAVTWHGEKDGGYDILDRNKGIGFINVIDYYGHHSHSMNHWFLNPAIRPGDWVILRDTLEQLNSNFLKDLRNFTNFLKSRKIFSVYQYSKLLLFAKAEHQFFAGTPHWGLQGAIPDYLSIENVEGLFQDPKNYAFSIRNDVRPREEFINHFVKYYLMDSSNHLVLECGGNNEWYHEREMQRWAFKKLLETNGVELTYKALLEHITKNGLSDELKAFFNKERFLNDFYRFHILKQTVDEIIKDHPEKKLYLIS